MNTLKTARGFSLVELSIVLVIIGIIIGGVLTGQQVMESARITNAVNAIQAYQAQVQTYNQNFNALPGDDANADSRFSGVSACSGDGCGDGIIGTNDSFNTSATTGEAAESRLIWSHLRAANLVKNTAGTDSTAQPSNPFGGIYGFQNGTSANSNLDSNLICLSNIPGAAAQAIDARLDDGVRTDGQLQDVDTSTDTSTSYVDGKTYSLCMKM